MELRHIRYFIRAAELLHFTRAAESLFISQPTLSIHIQQLEEELGSPLFARVGRQVRLTEAGDLFLERARNALRELETAQEEIADLKGLLRGNLHIGALFSLSQELIPLWLSVFNAAYPEIHVTVQSGTPYEIEHAVSSGAVNLALSFLPPDSDDLDCEELFMEEIVVVVAKSHPLASKTKLELDDLSHISLVLPGQTGTFAIRRLVDKRLSEAKVFPKVLAEMNDIHALVAIAEMGKAATILSRTAVGNRPELQLIPLPGEPLYTSAGVVWQKSTHLSPAAKAFLKVVKANLPIKDGQLQLLH